MFGVVFTVWEDVRKVWLDGNASRPPPLRPLHYPGPRPQPAAVGSQRAGTARRGIPMQRWKIGDVTVSKVVEIELAGKATWILPEATADNLRKIPWCQPHFVDSEGQSIMSVHALLVESRGRRIVVDTCIGNDKNLPAMKAWHKKTGGTFLADLEAAGFPADSVDVVLCTHLHVDHVGWNTIQVAGRWRPTFPNARYLWNREEYEYWAASDPQIQGDVVAESVAPVFEAGLVDLVDADCAITDEVRLEPTRGHTPGHVSVHIRSRGEEAVITGDLTHHPAQLARPEWRSSADWDGEMAEATRRTFFERYADRPVLVIGTHFATPTAGRIVRDGEVWRLEV
jgi:glyoxylase-like metal-dependent hydrolase (beta-lactamase superfamily II)